MENEFEKLCGNNNQQDIFSPALLRYNWHLTLWKFKVYSMVIWYMYTFIYLLAHMLKNRSTCTKKIIEEK